MTAPTPYPDINEILFRLLTEVQSVLGSRFVGLYLYGSLASGDFDLDYSDIDFLVVADGEIPPDLVPELEALHARLMVSVLKWATKLEGSYIAQAALRRYNPADPPRPTLNEGRFYLDQHGSDWVIQRLILREQGVTVAGPELRPWIDPVTPDEIRQAVRQILDSWWRPMLQNSDWLRDDEYQAFAVLTMCRAIHALRHGTIVSKPAAARWAQAELPDHWRPLIEQALVWERGQRINILAEALAFIEYALEQSPD